MGGQQRGEANVVHLESQRKIILRKLKLRETPILSHSAFFAEVPSTSVILGLW